VLLPEVEAPDSPDVVAEKIRAAVEAAVFPTVGRLTVSIGVGVAEPSDRDSLALLKRADMCLYEAKAAGRNRVV